MTDAVHLAPGPARVETPRMVGVRPRPEHGLKVVALWRDPRVIPTLRSTPEGPNESTLPDNAASRRVMEKTGFTYEGDTARQPRTPL